MFSTMILIFGFPKVDDNLILNDVSNNEAKIFTNVKGNWLKNSVLLNNLDLASLRHMDTFS